MSKLFDDMSRDEKIEHIKKMVSEAQIYCEEIQLYDAEILDFLDLWVPWLIEQVEKTNVK